ncbi:DedA family protein [Clostridium sp.]|uniref:DedA family protein n=1 Tax=Clostridium sp. TaxID=1506 RepID=UPI00321622E1
MDIINDFLNLVITTIQSFGYIGVFLAVFLEYACFPLPSEILLPFIGFLSSNGNFSFLGVILVSTMAGLIGSTLCYLIGYFGGSPIIHWLCNKFSGAKRSFDKLDIFISKYGKAAVFITRLFPLTRTYISLAVGTVKMKYSQFILYSFGGIVIWNTILISLGYYLGENTDLIKKILSNYSIVAITLLILVTLIVLYKFIKRKKHLK